VAPARAEALPRDRRAARSLGARGARPLGRHPRRRHALVVGQPRGEGLPRPQPDPYRWLDLDRDPEARALCESVPADARKLPLLFFPDGAVLSAPSRRDIAEKVGLRTQAARSSTTWW
jgi:hypothetical protein